MIDRPGARAHLRMRLLRQRVGQRRGLLVLQLGGGSRHPRVVNAASEAEHALLGGPLRATYCCGLRFAGLAGGSAVPCERRPGAVGALVAACKQASCAVTTSLDTVQNVSIPTSLALQVGLGAQQLPDTLSIASWMQKDMGWKNGATPLPSVALTSVASVGSMAPLSEPEPEPLTLPSSSEPLVPALLPLSERGRPSLPLLQSPLEPPSPVDPFSASQHITP